MTYPVGGPAQQSPIVQLGHGGIGDDTARSGPGYVSRAHLHALRRVVESPPELNVLSD